jgi:hypothetical protein
MESFNFEQAFKEAKAQARVALPEPTEYNQFEVALVEKPRAVIDRLLDSSSRMIFGGGSKTFKTWAMSDMALSIAAGASWWGFNTHQMVVLYVNFELKEFYAQARFKAIRGAKRIQVPQDYFLVWNLRGYDVTLLEFKAKLLELIQSYGIMVVFIDPFYRLLGASDERISAELMPILMAFEEINRLSGAAIVCAAHFTKGNQAAKDPMDRISGGASLNRHPDCLLTLTKHDTDHAFTIDLICRDFPPIDPFVVRWDHPLLRQASDLDPKDIKKIGRPMQYTQEHILGVLRTHDDELGTTELQKLVAQETGMSRPVFYRVWANLQAQGLVFRSKMSGNWNIKSPN